MVGVALHLKACHTTPELRHLQPKLDALMPYRQAAGVLDTFLPTLSSFNHTSSKLPPRQL